MQVDEGISGARAIEEVKRQRSPAISNAASTDASKPKQPQVASGPATVGSGLARGLDGKPVAPVIVERPKKARRQLRKVL
jgi:hypothetical protein